MQKQFSDEVFTRVPLKEQVKKEIVNQATSSYWQDVGNRLFRNKGAVLGLAILFVITFLAVFGPVMTPFGFDEQRIMAAKLPPKVPFLENFAFLPLDGIDETGKDIYAEREVEHYYWFGTDGLGRDQWTRVWVGTRISLYIALLAAVIDMVIGVIYGSIAAYYGGKVDMIMQRVIEIINGVPSLIVVILMILVLKPGIMSITIALAVTGWTSMARVVRGQMLKMKEHEFVLAAKTLGASDSRILMKHLIPNLLNIVLIHTMFTIPSAIFFEAFLSFIGLGLQPPAASLGTLVNNGFASILIFPHLLVFPALVISLIMIGFNLFADGLRDVLDPHLRE